MSLAIRIICRIDRVRNAVDRMVYENWSKYGVKKLKGSGSFPPKPLLSLEPTCGLEPQTPSLPWTFISNSYR
jgi:hypothetical protein